MENKVFAVLFLFLGVVGQISHMYGMTQDDGSRVPGVIIASDSEAAKMTGDEELKVVDLDGPTDVVVAGVASMNITEKISGDITGGQRDESPGAPDDSRKSKKQRRKSSRKPKAPGSNKVERVASMDSHHDSDDSRSKSKVRHSRKPNSVDQDAKRLATAKVSSYVEIKKGEKRQVFDVTPRKLYLMVDNFSKSKDYPKHRVLAYNNNHLRNDAILYFTQIFKTYPDSLKCLLEALNSDMFSKGIHLFFYLLHTKLVNPYEFLEKVAEMDRTIKVVSGNLKLLGIRYGKTELATQGGEIHGGSKHNLIEAGFPELFMITDAKTTVSNHDIYEFSGLFLVKMAVLTKDLKTPPMRSDSSESESQSRLHTRQESKSIWAFPEEELAQINEILSKKDDGCCSSCGCCTGCPCGCCVIF